MPNFPTIALLLRHKQPVPWLVTAAFVFAGLWVTLRTGVPEATLAGLVVGGAMYVFTRCFLELVQVIAETLLPQ